MLSKVINPSASAQTFNAKILHYPNVLGLVSTVQATTVVPAGQVSREGLKFPVLVHRLDCPLKFLSQRLGKELFNRDTKLFGKDHREAWVDIILPQALH